MSRKKNRELNSRVKRYQPMPWLSTCVTDQRPVFALTLQRMMSGCEMVDYGVSSNSSAGTTSTEQERVVVDLNSINVNVENLRLQLADFNGNTIFKETPGLVESELVSLQPIKETDKQLLLESGADKITIDEPNITYDYASIIEGVSSAENWWQEDVVDVTKLQNCISISSDNQQHQQQQQQQQVYDCTSYELDNRLVELMPNSSSLVVTLPHYYEPYQNTEVDESNLIDSSFSGNGADVVMNGQFCKIEVLDSRIKEDGKSFIELLGNASTTSLQNRGEVTIYGLENTEVDNSIKLDGRKKKRKRDNSDVEKSIVCSRCGKKFKKEGHLKTHFVVHTMNENGASVCYCAVCGKSFCHRGALTLHMRAHVPKQQNRNEI